MYRIEKAVTITVTMRVMTSTMMVFRRSMKKKWLVPQQRAEALTTRYFFLARDCLGSGAAVFLQLIMKCFQADAQNLRGSCLVVAGRLQRFQNQHFLGFFHGGADAQSNRIGIIGRGAERGLPKAGGQMLGLNHAGIAYDDCALDRVAQLPHVARP